MSPDMEYWIQNEEHHYWWNRDDIPMYIQHTNKPEGSEIQKFINYAYLKADNHLEGMDFVYTLEVECGRWIPQCAGVDGELGIGQFHDSHEEFKTSEQFADIYNQIDYARDVRLDWKYRKNADPEKMPYN